MMLSTRLAIAWAIVDFPVPLRPSSATSTGFLRSRSRLISKTTLSAADLRFLVLSLMCQVYSIRGCHPECCVTTCYIDSPRKDAINAINCLPQKHNLAESACSVIRLKDLYLN